MRLQQAQIPVPGDLDGPHPLHVIRDELDIQYGGTDPVEVGNQPDQTDLGSIGPALFRQRKHRLSHEHATQQHPVETTHKNTLSPRFHAVRQTTSMKIAIGLDETIINPRLGARCPGSGTGTHHLFEGGIGHDLEAS